MSGSSCINYRSKFDDTLLVIKPDKVKEVRDSLNKFDKNFDESV